MAGTAANALILSKSHTLCVVCEDGSWRERFRICAVSAFFLGLSLVSGCAAQQRICEEEMEEQMAMRNSTISSSTDLIPPQAAAAAADNFSTSINPMFLQAEHQNAAFFPRSGSSFSVVRTVRPLMSLSSSTCHHLQHPPVQVSKAKE
jgi:hypothetical protein